MQIITASTANTRSNETQEIGSMEISPTPKNVSRTQVHIITARTATLTIGEKNKINHYKIVLQILDL